MNEVLNLAALQVGLASEIKITSWLCSAIIPTYHNGETISSTIFKCKNWQLKAKKQVCFISEYNNLYLNVDLCKLVAAKNLTILPKVNTVQVHILFLI